MILRQILLKKCIEKGKENIHFYIRAQRVKNEANQGGAVVNTLDFNWTSG